MDRRLISALCLMLWPLSAQAGSVADQIAAYEAAAGGPADLAAGKALFHAEHSGGKPDTPSCLTCHGSDLTKEGRLRTGKTIAPMAPSVQPDRYTDPEKVEKWFGRNCTSVLGRECTAAEKRDLLAWLASL
ncbi:MAG: DUF1924 domain-containing protein [Albidovulum sp.]